MRGITGRKPALTTEGDDRAVVAVHDALAEVGTKGRASADRYRAAGHSVTDQSWLNRKALNWRARRVAGGVRSAIYDEVFQPTWPTPSDGFRVMFP